MPKPKMTKLFTGRGKTRPIPLIIDSSEKRAINAAAADQRPKGKAVNFPQGPRVGGVNDVFGKQIGSGGFKGGVTNPSGLGETI